MTITAKIARAANTYTAVENQVEFSVGNVSLGTVDVNNNEAYLTIALSEENGFVIGENTITAQYGGSMGLKTESGTATLTIERITPNPTTPTGLTAVYGQTLADVSLPEKWAWDAPETSVGNAGENTFPATYTQDDSGNYNPVTKDLTVQVTPAAYQITLTGQPDSPIQITLNEAAVEPGNTGTRVTYGCSTTNAAPDSWKAERAFSGLTADTTYYFFAKAEATANHAETISQGVAITTPKKSMSKLEISHQPDDLSYTSGQALDLSGLSVKVSYDDNTSETILWDSGKLTADPAQGTVLRAAKHHGKTISVSYGGKTVQTQALTVKKAAQAALSITGAPDKIYKGSSFTLEISGGSGEGAVTWQVVKGSATVDEKGTVTVSGTGEFQIQAVKTADAEYEQAQVVITLTAVNKTSSGGSDSQNKEDSSDTTTNRPDRDAPNTPTTSQTPPVKPEPNGNANIDGNLVQNAIDKATADAKKNGSTGNGIALVVPVDMGGTPKDVQIILKAETLDKLVSSKVKRFTIDTDCMTDFGFDQDILKELNRQTSGDIVIKVKKIAPSSEEAKAAIGTRPAYDISLWEVKNGEETQLTDLKGKAISIAIPYTPAQDEQPGRLYAVSVDAAGKVQWITKSSCDGDQKAVIFHLTQPGIYAVGYDAQVPAFTDIENHWAEDNILFAVSRGLLDGTSETTFSPDSGMTRGMFATALGRLAGIDPDSYQTGKFTDVKADADYAPYVNWAASKGIMAGTSATTFAPDSTITREQMAMIMKNYAARMGNTIPKTLEAVTFADNASISSEARETVKSLQQAGILAGKTNNRFDSAGTATRAEVATVLRRFVEIVIDSQTANGWVQNDGGQWSYCQNGKRLSDGWKQIDGKQYYFYPDGSMAVNTTVDGYQVGTDGARTN